MKPSHPRPQEVHTRAHNITITDETQSPQTCVHNITIFLLPVASNLDVRISVLQTLTGTGSSDGFLYHQIITPKKPRGRLLSAGFTNFTSGIDWFSLGIFVGFPQIF